MNSKMSRRTAKKIVLAFGLTCLLLAAFVLFLSFAIGDKTVPTVITERDFVESRLTESAPKDCASSWDSARSEARLIWNPKEFKDYDALVAGHFERGIEFTRKVFSKIPKVVRVSFVTTFSSSASSGSKGTRSAEVALHHEFLRVPFNAMNWDSLKGCPIDPSVSQAFDSTITYVNPSVFLAANWNWVQAEMTYR